MTMPPMALAELGRPGSTLHHRMNARNAPKRSLNVRLGGQPSQPQDAGVSGAPNKATFSFNTCNTCNRQGIHHKALATQHLCISHCYSSLCGYGGLPIVDLVVASRERRDGGQPRVAPIGPFHALDRGPLSPTNDTPSAAAHVLNSRARLGCSRGIIPC